MSLLSDQEINHRLGALSSGWRGEGKEIVADWIRKDFGDAIAFVNQVAEVAEQADHHPDILVHGYNKVRLRLSTHSQGGLTASDFDLAEQIDRLV